MDTGHFCDSRLFADEKILHQIFLDETLKNNITPTEADARNIRFQ